MRRIFLAIAAAVAMVVPVTIVAAPALANGSTCNLGTDFCDLEQQDSYFVQGFNHGEILISDPTLHDQYTFSAAEPGWGYLKTAGSECWNEYTDPTHGDTVAIDSCVNLDHRELWRFVADNNHYLIQNYNLGTSWDLEGFDIDDLTLSFAQGAFNTTLWDAH